MPLLYPYLTPTVGQPSPVVAAVRQRRRQRPNMAVPDFYKNQSPTQPVITPDYQPVDPERDFIQPAKSGTYLQEQLQRYAQRAAPPQLEPAARVSSPDSSLVAPTSFQQYYQQLNNIGQIAQEQLAAESARAAFARSQALANISKITVPAAASGNVSFGQNFGSGIPSNPAANFRYAQEIAPKYGWSGNELSAWYKLGMNESGWRNTAQNPKSSAYGIGQFLNGTWGTVGGAKTSDPRLQTEYMARYIKQRYGTPSRALAAWNSRSPHWY